MSDVLRAADALADAAEALRDGTSSNRRANLTVALDAYRAARDAAPADEIDRLRAELAETRAELGAVREERGKYGKGWRAAQVELAATRDRRDYLQGQLDIIYDAEYSRNDTLRRRIEKLTAAGDAVLELHKPIDGGPPDSPHKLCNHCINGVEELYKYPCPTVEAWRSVRGDTPADGFGATDTVSVPPKPTQNAAPAVAHTDGQPPADDTAWTSVCEELHLDADAPASTVVARLRLLKSRYERLSEAAGRDRCPAGGSAPASTDGDTTTGDDQ